MKRYIILIIILSYSCQGKKNDAEQLRLIPKNEVISRARANNLDYSNAIFKGANGLMSAQENSLLKKGKLARDFYENSPGEISEVRVRSIELADKFLEIQINAAATNPLSQIEFIDIDCNQLGSLYDEVFKADQQVRNGYGEMDIVDSLNRQTVVSAIFQCGWSEEHLLTTWLVFQHSPLDIMIYFYPELKKYSEEGKLNRGMIALMEDRLLMQNGYKQIYGSQISGGRLFDLEEPDSVNIRRATMDLGSIEDYMDHWGLDWEEEKARMKLLEKE